MTLTNVVRLLDDPRWVIWSCMSLHAQGKVDLPKLFVYLAREREINEVHVEAGHKLNGSLIREGCVDELLI